MRGQQGIGVGCGYELGEMVLKGRINFTPNLLEIMEIIMKWTKT